MADVLKTDIKAAEDTKQENSNRASNSERGNPSHTSQNEEDASHASDNGQENPSHASDNGQENPSRASDSEEEDQAHVSGSEQEDATHPPNNEQINKPSIKFKDAVGRTFVFPFHLVQTWSGMEGLIKEAFLHVDVLGPLVAQGYYDLSNSKGEIILPRTWEDVIEPGWNISMAMWPLGPLGPSTNGPQPSRLHAADSEKRARGRFFKVPRFAVFDFPRDTDTSVDKGRFLTLVIFFIVFSRQAVGAEIVLSCRLRSLFADGITPLQIAKTAFFRPSGAMYEPLEKQPISVTSSGAPEFDDSCKFLVESWKDHIFAVLLWRPKHEFPVTVPATFQARDAETDEIWLCDSSDISASLSPAPVKGPQPWTPFSWALRCNWQDALQLLLQQPEVLQNVRDSVGRSALSWAAGTGHELATGLLMARPDTNPNEQDDQGRTPLSWAAGAGQTRIMQILLGSDHGDGVDLDSPARSGRTRRSWAAAEGKVGSVRVSLSSEKSKTANPSIPDKHGRTPLSWAAGNGHAEAVQLLIRQGKMTGLTEELTGDGKLPDNSPFFWAARNGHDNVLRLLLEEQLSRAPTSVSLSYQTYLHKAAKQGWATVVKLLVQQGVSIDTQDPDNDDYTPLCVAAESGLVDVVILLLQADANRNHQTSETRETPLHLAVRHGHDAVVKALIEAGADITLMDAKGDSPKSLAQRLNNDHIFNMIAAVDKEGGLAETASAQYLVPSVDLEFLATVVDFTPGSGSVENTAMELNVSSLLKDPHARLRQLSGRRAIRWLHLPANNMRWVELLMMGLCGSKASAYRVLDPERWVKRQHHGATRVHHARFMRPHCQEFLGASQSLNMASAGLRDGQGRSLNNLVLFMPFLHWDLEDLRLKREQVVKAAVEGREQNLSNRDLNIEQKLLKAYLTNQHPLHLRRTLDQYYYHTLEDTRERDADQVVSRHQTFTGLRPRIITMVDQLWLWVLSGEGSLPDTVVTCFPHVGKGGGENDENDPDPEGLTSVLQRIKRSLLDKSFRVQTAYDLAGLIAATCSRLYLDPGSTLTFRKGPTMFQFAELYETEISNIVQGETVLFSSFAGLKKGDVADISEEIKLLSRIKDVLDELNIMRILFGDQRKVLRTLDGIVKSASDLEKDRQIEMEDGASWQSVMEESPKEAQPPSQGSNSPEDEHPEVHENTSQEKQGARYIWGNRGEPEAFSYPLAMVTASLEEIGAMIERAEKAEEALLRTVDLKQKHNSVTDSQESLKQGRTVLIFTLTTIIFLPLSFLASFFTIEISQFRRNSDGLLDLGYVSYIVFPVSSVVSAVLIWVAFNVDSAKNVWNGLTRLFEQYSDQKSTQKKEEDSRRLLWELVAERSSRKNRIGDPEA